MQKCGTKYTKKRTLVYKLRQEECFLLDISWEGTRKLFTALHVSVNDHENTMRIDSGVTNIFLVSR